MADELTAEAVQAIRVNTALSAAGITLVLLDHAYTFPQEVRVIWPTRWTIPKVLIFAVRYGTIALALLEFLWILPRAFSEKGCKRIFKIVSLLEVALSALGEVIIYIRVWAFARRSRMALYCLSAQFIIVLVICLLLIVRSTSSAMVSTYAPLPGLSCIFQQGGSLYMAMAYVAMLYSVTTLTCVMIIVGMLRYRELGPLGGRRFGIVGQLYRGGLLYFFVLGALCIGNIVSNIAGTRGYQHVFSEIQIYLHSIIATRITFQLRQFSADEANYSLPQIDIQRASTNLNLREIQLSDVSKSCIPTLRGSAQVQVRKDVDYRVMPSLRFVSDNEVTLESGPVSYQM
ncbi:hypothetical protein DFP72DRAFT_927973 [Ephemerocybe angulata]|uniref:DUF6533 domain-containing protein n=1 Tax=Ephemerocybe angulata TaxID=980116 RepID=A0A8H6LWF1_9AGAR|nr:hypothetical protein DFP72DRAFT_927973 [Tulosesus angulatus]